MRTKKDIQNYLRRQNWYSQFIRNIDITIPTSIVKRLLNGELYEQTICGAFDYDKTPEKKPFWDKVEKDFINWYEK